MKKIFNYICSVALGSMLLVSCDLDTTPTTYVAEDKLFKTTNECEMVVNGAWAYLMETFNSYANPGYGAMLRASDAMGSDVVLNGKYGFSSHYKLTSIYGKSGTNTLSWLLAYRVINDCNNVLDRIDAAEGKEADRNRVKGQAIALRGFMYLHLAQFYAFAIDKDPNAVCAPIYTQATTIEIAKQGNPAANVSEVYAQAISDLEAALKLIPANYNRSAKHKINTQVVNGLLARAFLYSRQWEKAAEHAAAVLTHSDYLMNPVEWMSGFNDVSNDEWIWGHAQTTDQANASYQFHFLDTTTPGTYYFSFNVDPYFRDRYEEGDFRKEMIYWDVDPQSDPGKAKEVWMRNAKFTFRDMMNELADIVLMRNAEIYLIFAEAKARLNQDAEALTKLNALREARGLKAIDTSLSGQALLDEIWMERRRELWGEGFSLVDIIRNQKSIERTEYQPSEIDYTYLDESTQQKVTKKVLAKGHHIMVFPDGSKFAPNSKYYLFRIPDSEELNNTKLYDKYPKLDIY